MKNKNQYFHGISYFRGVPFIQYIDEMPSLKRQVDGPFMMPIVDK